LSAFTPEKFTEEQIRQIIFAYLDEVMRYYKEQQRILLDASANGRADQRFEQSATDLLGAMSASVNPIERRKAVLQVLCRAKQHSEPSLPS